MQIIAQNPTPHDWLSLCLQQISLLNQHYSPKINTFVATNNNEVILQHNYEKAPIILATTVGFTLFVYSS